MGLNHFQSSPLNQLPESVVLFFIYEFNKRLIQDFYQKITIARVFRINFLLKNSKQLFIIY